ncbi:MAG: Crp/Fnr family transcriptional regulator, partial [Chitinophagaceae bacterium]
MKKSKASFEQQPQFVYTKCIKEWWPALDANKQISQFKKGELIFKEDDPIKGMYFVIEGVVKVHKHWVEEKELIIRFAKENDIIGHRGLSTHSDVYPISATTLTPCTVCFLDLSFFYATLKVNPAFMFDFMMFFADELRLSEQRMRDLAHMPVKERVLKTLLTIEKKFGINDEGFINFDISRQDIAAFTGAAYETVYKLLIEFTNSGLIKTDGK